MRAEHLGWKLDEEGGERPLLQGVTTSSSASKRSSSPQGSWMSREDSRCPHPQPSEIPLGLLSTSVNTSVMLGTKHDSLWNCVLWQRLMILPLSAAGTFHHWSRLGKKLKWSPSPYHISPLESEMLNLLQRSKKKSQHFWKPDLDFCQL